jgi:hypothetical protein
MGDAVDGIESPPLPEFSAEQLQRIREMDVMNIRLKVANGEVLTREQMKRLEMALPDDEVEEQWVETQQALADALGVADRKSIQRWLKEPMCPGVVDGRYNVKDWKLWCETKGKRAGTKGTRLDSLKEKTVAIDLRLKELELAEAMGRSISLDEALTVFTSIVTSAMQKLRGVKHDVAPRVVGETVPEASKRIGQAIDECLAELARVPEGAKKKTFWRNVFAELSLLQQRWNLGATPTSTSGCTTAIAGTKT